MGKDGLRAVPIAKLNERIPQRLFYSSSSDGIVLAIATKQSGISAVEDEFVQGRL
jgi:hypothetical protein